MIQNGLFPNDRQEQKVEFVIKNYQHEITLQYTKGKWSTNLINIIILCPKSDPECHKIVILDVNARLH